MVLTGVIDFDDVTFSASSKRYFVEVVDNTTTNMDTPEVYLNIQLETYDETTNTWEYEQFALPYQFTDMDDNFIIRLHIKWLKECDLKNPNQNPTPTSSTLKNFVSGNINYTVDQDMNDLTTSSYTDYLHLTT